MSTILNTAYNVQTDILESESNISIENGTLHVYNDKLKVHLQNEIREIATTNTIKNINLLLVFFIFYYFLSLKYILYLN
jgi:hypothetical protein